MTRVFLALLVLAALPLGSAAGETTVRLNVRPMAAPKPTLKYQLLPEVRELKPGNPAQWYVRCFQEQQNFFFTKEANAQRALYLSMPLSKLPAAELRTYGRSALTQADWAARLDALDWQVLQRVQTEGFDLVLTEAEPLRTLGTALRVRFRGQVAGRHFDEAIVSAKTMFALARHLGDHPTLTANLVGLSIAEMALESLEEMVQQEGCPNLYWALTDLPGQLVDVRKGFQGDQARMAVELRALREDVVMTEAELEKVIGRLSGVMSFAREQEGHAPRSLRIELRTRTQDAERVRAARRRLIEAGRKELLVLILTPVQVILLDEKRAYEIQRDDAMKVVGLAPWQIDTQAGSKDLEVNLFADFLPAAVKVRLTQARLERRIALLRHVEGLRQYAAAHDGQLPARLADLPVPLPLDPFTGERFHYQLDGAIAHLRGQPPRGEEKKSEFHIRYEVTVKK